MNKRLAMAGCTLVVALAVGACSSRTKPPVYTMSNGECMSIADTLKTLRVGDELPRVAQVMGQPSRSYRVVAPFGRTYDVMEYDVGQTACAKTVLNAPKKLEIVFDEKGQLSGFGRSYFRRVQAATLVRVQGLPVDVNQFGN